MKQKIFIISVILVLFVAAISDAEEGQRRTALVIGNSAYKTARPSRILKAMPGIWRQRWKRWIFQLPR